MGPAKRLAVLALGGAVAALLATPAHASYHLLRVNEVFPSATASQQFVELKDTAQEPFPPLAPYYLALFNGAGGFIAKQTLNPDDGFRMSTAPFLLGASMPYDAKLNFTLPAGTGQVCYYLGDPQAGGGRINCLGYGNVTMRLGDTGPAPPAGQSLQRLACGVIGTAAPTRDAENAACPSYGGGGGGGGARSSDTKAPSVRIKAGKRQDVDKLAVVVRSNEDATATVRASVAVPTGAARTLRFKTVKTSLRAGARKKIRLRLKRSSRRAVKRALAHRRRLRAMVKITVADKAGNTTVKRLKIRLKD
jgi:hypothetical protein